MFVKTEGRIFYFCDSKCEKNFRMGRQGKDIRWTDSSAKERGKQA
jgi:large subunit ribosomal protein L24e